MPGRRREKYNPAIFETRSRAVIDLFNLAGLLFCFVGSLLLVLFRMPAVELTSDGRSLSGVGPEPSSAERAANLRRYWRNAAAAKVGMAFLCAGFGLQLLAFVAGYAAADETDAVSHKILSMGAVRTGR